MNRVFVALGLSVVVSLAGFPCGSGGLGGEATDLLDKVRMAGTLRVATDANYPPQSFFRPNGEPDGFDVDVARKVARRLGVGVEFEFPDWDLIVAGNWQGR